MFCLVDGTIVSEEFLAFICKVKSEEGCSMLLKKGEEHSLCKQVSNGQK
jgi:hypothetical protein